MKNEAWWERLHAQLDDRLDPNDDPELQALAEQDPEVRAVLAAERQLLAGLKELRAPGPPRDFAARVVDAYRASKASEPQAPLAMPVPRREPHRDNPRTRFAFATSPAAWATLAAISAAVLLAVLFAVQPSGPTHVQSPGPQSNPAKSSPAIPAQVAVQSARNPAPSSPASLNPGSSSPGTPDERPLNELFREASEKYYSLAAETQNSFADLAMLLPAAQPGTANANPGTNLPGTTGPGTNAPVRDPIWLEQMGHGLEPFSEPVQDTIHYLWELLPSKDSRS